MNYIRITFILFIVFVFLYKLLQANVNVQEENKDYRVSISINSNNQALFNTVVLGFDNFIIEPIIDKKNYIKINLDSNQQKRIDIDNSFSSDSLSGYFLSSINSDNVYIFDSFRQFINEIPKSQKKKGFLFEKNINPIASFIDNFRISGDTLINGKPRKLLTFEKKEGDIETTYRITLDQSITNKIRIHPISTDLDNKFNGTCMSLEILSKNKNEINKVIFSCSMSVNLTQEEQNMISYFKEWRTRR